MDVCTYTCYNGVCNAHCAGAWKEYKEEVLVLDEPSKA